ncbi:hypothetical protein G6O69_07075 [Pseudenhygromyxa sp. WMMC2535]|uniref:hypothetical protein n=1 Tax=Pseudenhygromyxa sp. WMMC2535 TaxID=2712867 RepID=UPI001594E8D4|nr:hypothetical protein [Pseudenhygromyxa sp. WMMC2535]NVB37589.1 hypothetical protein [Pseudenhygromyxa sp. WMMC2535]
MQSLRPNMTTCRLTPVTMLFPRSLRAIPLSCSSISRTSCRSLILDSSSLPLAPALSSVLATAKP